MLRPFIRKFQVTKLRGSPIGFFNPVIRTQNFVQSHDPEAYFGHSNSHAHFQSLISPDFALKSRIPSFKWGKSRIPKNLLGTLNSIKALFSYTAGGRRQYPLHSFLPANLFWYMRGSKTATDARRRTFTISMHSGGENWKIKI